MSKKFDLGAEEVFVPVEWTRRGKSHKGLHWFKQPTREVSEEYLRRIKSLHFSHESGSDDNEAVQGGVIFEARNDSTDADLQLWEKLIVKVEGYVSASGDLMSHDNWRTLVPAPHKQAAAGGIFYLGVQPAEKTGDSNEHESEITFDDQLEVILEAAQNGVLIRNLVHRFRYPTPFELKRWNQTQATSRQKIKDRRRYYLVENSLRFEIDLYDSMIQGVEGYQFNGEPLQGEPAVISSIMNPFHKKYAIAQAFETVRLGEAEGPLGQKRSGEESVSA